MSDTQHSLTAIGLMSGTSMDGVDAALVETDGREVVTSLATVSIPYDGAMRGLLWQAVEKAAEITDPGIRDEVLSRAEEQVTRWHATAVECLREKCGDAGRNIDVIGFHGQTVLHRPDLGFTVQLGDGELLSRLAGCDVVNDFRSNDMSRGGQGAPLAPVYHMALAASLDERPVVFLNLGGVANVTWIGEGDPIAFDTGPANGLIDEWMLKMDGRDMDKGGAVAAQGTVNRTVLDELLAHRFFKEPAPKSLDRFDFQFGPVAGLSLEDGAATLTAFTAASVALALEHLPGAPEVWVACGGGRHNETLMAALARELPGRVVAAEAVGLRGDSLEAEAFAYMAVRSLRQWPLSFPSTTGVDVAVSGGRLHKAA